MKHFLILLSTLAICLVTSAQNVGIGTQTPSELLDVNGNVNVAGTIKANGTAPASNQVLTATENGLLKWSDLSNYTHMALFFENEVFTVPAGVTHLLAEMWGGGGGGCYLSGGGGGGYARSVHQVVEGEGLTVVVGDRGNGGTTSGTSGGFSSVTQAAKVVLANGGGGATASGGGTSSPGSGGSFTSVNGLKSFTGEPGQYGKVNELNYLQSGASIFTEVSSGGDGGNAGNTSYTGGRGAYRALNITSSTLTRYGTGSPGKFPGGGGGAGYDLVSAAGGEFAGSNGGQGLVVIHW